MRDAPSKIVNTYQPDRTGNQKLSRYRNVSAVVDREGNDYLQSPVKKKIVESERDSFYTVEPECEDRIDIISYKFYNTPHLWWAIAMMNHIKNPMRVEAGIILRIPPLDHITL